MQGDFTSELGNKVFWEIRNDEAKINFWPNIVSILKSKFF